MDQAASFPIPRLPAEVLVHDEQGARALGSFNQLERLGIRGRERLLADDRNAALRGGAHQLEVRFRRGDDVDELGPGLVEHLFHRPEAGRAHGRKFGRIPVAPADELGSVRQRAPAGDMKLAEVARAHAGHTQALHRLESTASRIARVPALPPNSNGTTFLEANTSSTARSIFLAASASAGLPARSASQSSIIAAERMHAVGLALLCPKMSGAEPWQGWKSAWSSPMSPEGAMPMPPTSAAVWSDRMSPNMFSVTITSNSQGLRTRSSAVASM